MFHYGTLHSHNTYHGVNISRILGCVRDISTKQIVGSFCNIIFWVPLYLAFCHFWKQKQTCSFVFEDKYKKDEQSSKMYKKMVRN